MIWGPFSAFRVISTSSLKHKVAPPTLRAFYVSNDKRSQIVVRRVILRLIFLGITDQTVSDPAMFRTLCRRMIIPSHLTSDTRDCCRIHLDAFS